MTRAFVYLLLSLPLVGAFALYALGIVVIHRASRVLNLAHGAMAMVPAYVTYSLVKAHVPLVLAFVAGIAAGAGIGAGVERVFTRRLRAVSPTAQTVGTAAALGLLIVLGARIWGTAPLQAPSIFPEGHINVGSSILRFGHIGLFAVAVIGTAGFIAFFRFTEIGLAMRGAAENRRAAALVGVDPDRTTSLAWMMGGALAALAGILLAAVTNLHPYTLSLSVLPAFVAALIGGLDSLGGALVGAAIVGVVQGMVPALSLVPGLERFAGSTGAPQLVLTALALLVMAMRGQRFVGSDVRSEAAAAGGVLRRAPARSGRARTGAVLLVPLLVLPWIPGLPVSIVSDANLAAVYSIVGVSLVVLTGWVGQISLAQASFVGIGAFATGLLVRGAGIPFPLTLPLAGGVTAGAAAVLGVVALRVRGLYLAVASLIFGWMADAYLFRSPWLVGAGGSSTIDVRPIGVKGGFPFFDLVSVRTVYFVSLALAALVLFAAVNLRDTKPGRAFFAVRGSEVAAASLGINVTRTKLLAFAFSGFVAGIAGNLLMVQQRTVVPSQFSFAASVFFLSMMVVGGQASVGGAVASAVLFAGLREVFFRVTALGGYLDLVSVGLLTIVLLGYQGGLAALGGSIRRRLHRLGARRGAAPSGEEGPDAEVRRLERPAADRAKERERRSVVLQAAEVSVRFGGLLAADQVSLNVREGEIVGLIGPNGAGKTTVFNAISGLVVPTSGSVHVLGTDATALPVHERARLGLGRTFQVLQLFPQLTVMENLMVATHMENHTSTLANLVVTRAAARREQAARAHVREVLSMLGLSDVADRQVAGLPFGILRIVELARGLVTRARVLMLDEIASGLDNNETDRLMGLLEDIRARFGVSILLIEHDVRMVTSVSDYMYVLERGRIIAEGTPEEIRRDEKVVSAYLGESVA